MALLRGFLPYRDYFTAGPPLNVFKAALLLKLFGAKVLVVRVAAVVERMVLASILMRWLQQLATPRHAAAAAFLTIILSAGDRTDPLASYNHDALFWVVVAGLLASGALRQGVSELRLSLLGCLCGVCVGLSLLTKQTVGGVMVGVLLLLPAYLLGRVRMRRGMSWSAGFCAGLAVPVGAVSWFLYRLAILHSALAMLFVTGPSAKAGHAGDFVRRWGMVGLDNLGWVVLGLFWCGLAWVATGHFQSRARVPAATKEPVSVTHFQPIESWLARACGGILVIFVAAELTRRLPALHDSTKAVVYTTAFGLIALLARAVVRRQTGASSLRADRILLFAACSAAAALALSLSWPAFEAMLLPGLGLLVALLLTRCTPRSRPLVYAVLAFLLLMQLREKLDLPFGFDLQDEGPVAIAQQQSRQPALSGLRLPPATVHFVDETTALIQNHTCQDDSVFTFPEMGLLYTLSDRWPPTWSPSHNIDVVNDVLARADAGRLLDAPPAVLVTYRESPDDWQGAERLWREGRPSGQRSLAEAVDRLARSYVHRGTYILRDGDPAIDVYLRPDASAARAQACSNRARRQGETEASKEASNGQEKGQERR